MGWDEKLGVGKICRLIVAECQCWVVCNIESELPSVIFVELQ